MKNSHILSIIYEFYIYIKRNILGYCRSEGSLFWLTKFWVNGNKVFKTKRKTFYDFRCKVTKMMQRLSTLSFARSTEYE